MAKGSAPGGALPPPPSEDTTWSKIKRYPMALLNLQQGAVGKLVGSIPGLEDDYARMKAPPTEGVSGIAATADAVGKAPGAGDVIGEAISQAVPDTPDSPWLKAGGHFLKNVGSILGDIGTDPLTYETGGLAAVGEAGKILKPGLQGLSGAYKLLRASPELVSEGRITAEALSKMGAGERGARAAAAFLGGPTGILVNAPDLIGGISRGFQDAAQNFEEGNIPEGVGGALQSLALLGLGGLGVHGTVHDLRGLKGDLNVDKIFYQNPEAQKILEKAKAQEWEALKDTNVTKEQHEAGWVVREQMIKGFAREGTDLLLEMKPEFQNADAANLPAPPDAQFQDPNENAHAKVLSEWARAFHSPLDYAIRSLPENQVWKAGDILNKLKAMPGVKKESLEWELPGNLDPNERVTKADLIEAFNPLKVQVRELSEYGHTDSVEERQSLFMRSGYPQYAAYTDRRLPGGTNYREFVVTLPYRLGGWEASHFRDFPNNLLHLRTQDFTGPKGEKTLHVEEVQSDLNQKGRDGGFADLKAKSPGPMTNAEYMALTPEEQIRAMNWWNNSTRPPHNPYEDVTKWAKLGMKVILKKAAAEGYDRVTWTTGETQNVRNHSTIKIEPGMGWEVGAGADPFRGPSKNEVTIYDSNPDDPVSHAIAIIPTKKFQDLTGIDPFKGDSIGQFEKGFTFKKEGHNLTYDKVLPSAVRDLVKGWGGKVEEGVPLYATPEDVEGVNFQNYLRSMGFRDGQFNPLLPEDLRKGPAPTQSPKVWSLSLPPSAKDHILGNSYSLFQGSGRAGAAKTKGSGLFANMENELHEQKNDLNYRKGQVPLLEDHEAHQWVKDFAEKAGIPLPEKLKYIGAGSFHVLGDLGTATKGPLAGQELVLRAGISSLEPPEFEGMIKRVAGVTTKNRWTLDVVPRTYSAEDIGIPKGEGSQTHNFNVMEMYDKAIAAGYTPIDIYHHSRNVRYTKEGKPIISDFGSVMPKAIMPTGDNIEAYLSRQGTPEDHRGATSFFDKEGRPIKISDLSDSSIGRTLIQYWNSADVSTPIHEFTHALQPLLSGILHPKTMEILERSLGITDGVWTGEAHEKFAQAMEKYAMDGKTQNTRLVPIMEKFRKWLLGTYTQADQDKLQISEPIRAAFDEMLGASRPSLSGKIGARTHDIEDPPGLSLDINSPNGRKSALGIAQSMVDAKVDHDELKSLAEMGWTSDQMAEYLTNKVGTKFTPEDAAVWLFTPTALGRGLGKLSELGKVKKEIASKYLEMAKGDPTIQKMLSNLEEEGRLDMPYWLQAMGMERGLTDKLLSLDKEVGGLARASMAGAISASVNNFMNGSFTYTLDTFANSMIHLPLMAWKLAKGDVEGATNLAKEVKNRVVTSPFQAFASVLSDMKETPKKGLVAGARQPGGTKMVRELLALGEQLSQQKEDGVRQDHLSQLYHKAEVDLQDTPRSETTQNLKTKMLYFNSISDRLVRHTYMLAGMLPLLDKYKMDSFGELAERVSSDPELAKEVSQTFNYSIQEALRASGGQQNPQGLVRSAVDLWGKVPLLWAIQPFAKFTVGNFIPVMLESNPLTMLLSKRARNSMRAMVLEKQIPGIEGQLNLLRKRNSILEKEKIGQLSPAEGKAYTKLVQDGFADPEKTKILLAGVRNRHATMKKELLRIKKDGVYSPQAILTHAMVGPMLMAAFAAYRANKGDDGTDYDQVQTEDGKAVNISSTLGPFALYALLGDEIGHTVLGSGKYDTESGFFRIKEILEAASSSRFGDSKLTQVLGADKISQLQWKKVVQGAAANIGRMVGTGAWAGDLSRRIDESFHPESAVSRRVDAPVGAGAVDSAFLGLGKGFASQIPGLRNQLPPSPNWNTGEFYPKLSPAATLFGGDLNAASKSKTLSGMIASLLPGRREELAPITQFFSHNAGFLSATQVLPSRTEDPVFDEDLRRAWSKQLQIRVLPRMQDIQAMPREQGVKYFQRLMVSARAWAMKSAEMQAIRERRSLPENISERAHKDLENRRGPHFGAPSSVNPRLLALNRLPEPPAS